MRRPKMKCIEASTQSCTSASTNAGYCSYTHAWINAGCPDTAHEQIQDVRILLIYTRMDKCRMSGYCSWTNSGCPDTAHGQMQNVRILLMHTPSTGSWQVLQTSCTSVESSSREESVSWFLLGRGDSSRLLINTCFMMLVLRLITN